MRSAPTSAPPWLWRPDNQLELLADANQFFPAMVQAIDAARQSILLELYLVASGQVLRSFIGALARARQRGVRVCLLFDDYGASGLRAVDRRQLIAQGMELCFYNPVRHHQPLAILWQVVVHDRTRSLHRDHRKLLVVDGQQAFVGGAGLTDDFQPEQGLGWRESLVRVRGPVVADLQQLFAHTWALAGGAPLSSAPAVPAPAGNDRVRVSLSDARRRNDIRRAALKRIRLAEERVWLATAYFLPPWRLRRALRRAARQGADVRILLPGPITDHPGARLASQRFYASLLRHGVRIFEYQPRFMHQKALLCDHWYTLGSCNLDRWNLRWNLELNLDTDAADRCQELAQLLTQDLQQSVEITLERWRQRPLLERFSAQLMGLVDLLVERLLRGRPREHRLAERPPRQEG